VRGLDFDLSADAFADLTALPCAYCGIDPPERAYGNVSAEAPPWFGNGIDRMDSSRGYVMGNVVACCFDCNRAKGAMSLDAFRSWVDRVHRKMSRGVS